MFVVNDDLSIYVTRGDAVYLKIKANKDGKPYTFQPGEVLRIKVFAKKNCEKVVLQKDFPVAAVTQGVDIVLDGNDTKIGGVISKPTDYWYEVELNPYDSPQTIIGYDEDGPRLFRLYPEGKDQDEIEPDPEILEVIDDELDMTSSRPVKNQVIARAFANLQGRFQAVHDAVADKFVTPQMFGAIGDGVSDDTEAITNALEYANGKQCAVVFPKGDYLVTQPITIPSGMDVSGINAVIHKRNESTVKVNGTSVNTVFLLTGSKTHLHDICIQGEADTGVDGITFDENSFMMSICRVTLKDCRKCFNDIGGIFMAEFDRVHCLGSLKAFVFDTNREKTSMTFKSCWAENCGQAYYFYRCHYTNLISCGADYCNYIDNSPYLAGCGDPATVYGVYHFSLCRATVMSGCGAEHCYGDGAVHCNATYLTINGLVCTDVKSEREVDPSIRAVGLIVHSGEASKIIINSLIVNNDFENVYVTEKYPSADQYLIAYNYTNSTYGPRADKGIIASALKSVSAPLLGGIGDYSKECLILDEHGKVVYVEEQLNVDGRKFYPVRTLTHASGSNKLTIPFISQSNCNYVHLIKVTGINNAGNSNIPNAFEFTLEISSLSNVNHATLINASSDAMSVATSGMNAVITLPATYTNLNISIETMSVKDNLINLDGISLG